MYVACRCEIEVPLLVRNMMRTECSWCNNRVASQQPQAWQDSVHGQQVRGDSLQHGLCQQQQPGVEPGVRGQEISPGRG